MTTIQPRTLTYVPGSTDPEQQLDLYLPASNPTAGLVVFIHGGAWRTGSRSDHTDLASHLICNGKAVAIIDYRLSVKDEKSGLAKVIHPTHAQDVCDALSFLRRREDVPKDGWIIVGHSIGAWLTLAAIIEGGVGTGNSIYPEPMPEPDKAARDAIKTCILVDGIFSITKLLKEYPDYEGFVAQAFLPLPGPSNYGAVSCETWPLALEGKVLHVWHSKDDELLSFKQSMDVIKHLDEQLSAGALHAGKAVDIPEDGIASLTNVDGVQKKVSDVYGKVVIKNSNRLHADLTTLSGAHDDLLHTEIFWNLILKL
ncbi:related to Serine protease [Melanopsichium pennsylvanicum]|uniref:Related to Serine protease n=2 Tax=Melanopsichium pennsylvanicum TaxID=63383 RepID=A0AAJ5C2F4_9BASI|nr:related to Serine protease [Melanopsichium pennsylvanicum 4]SNX81437.1 related to Serine protease [Melanopsichium pennsylvanicum]